MLGPRLDLVVRAVKIAHQRAVKHLAHYVQNNVRTARWLYHVIYRIHACETPQPICFAKDAPTRFITFNGRTSTNFLMNNVVKRSQPFRQIEPHLCKPAGCYFHLAQSTSPFHYVPNRHTKPEMKPRRRHKNFRPICAFGIASVIIGSTVFLQFWQ